MHNFRHPLAYESPNPPLAPVLSPDLPLPCHAVTLGSSSHVVAPAAVRILTFIDVAAQRSASTPDEMYRFAHMVATPPGRPPHPCMPNR